MASSWWQQCVAQLLQQAVVSACFVFSFVMFARCSSPDQLSVEEILRGVRETYQNGHSYRFVADVSTETAAVGEDRSIDGSSRTSNFHKVINSEIELDGITPGKVHLHIKDNASEILLIGDGSTIWTFLPKKKQYTEVSENTPSPETELLVYYLRLLAARFRTLQSHASNFALEKEKQFKLGGSKVDCYVLKMDTSQGTQKLWVDKTRFIVWRIEDSGPVQQEGISLRKTVTVNFREANLNAKLDDSLFIFAVSEKAERVQSLKIPAN